MPRPSGTPRRRAPACEVCGAEPAYSFSWFADPARWYAPESGTWRFTGDCTADTEHYYVHFHRRSGDGFLDSRAAQDDWDWHLRGKVWFASRDFGVMLERFVAAGGRLTPTRRGPHRGEPHAPASA